MVSHTKEFTARMNAEIVIDGFGLEVAPYFDPTLPKDKYNVLYTDYIDNENIKKKAAENPGAVNGNLCKIDFVWKSGSSLIDFLPLRSTRFDYIVASHVMEHVPNPIGWLNDLLEVKNIGGKIVLFLPNREVTFDKHRYVTRFSDLVTLWFEQPFAPTPGQVMDFMSNAVHPELVDDGRQSHHCYTDAEAIDSSVFVYQNDNYLDAHCTVWDPATFCKTFNRLVACGIMNVEVSEPMTCDHEFMVFIIKRGEPSQRPPKRIGRPKSERDEADSMLHQLAIVRDDLRHLNSELIHNANHISKEIAGAGDKIHSVKILLDQVAKRLFVRPKRPV